MDEHLPKGLPHPVPEAEPERPARKRRLKIVTDTQVIEVQDIWNDGFAIARSGPQPRHGFVDLLDDDKLLCRGLAYPSGETGDRRLYTFKMTREAGLAPPRDYVSTSDIVRR